MSNLSQLVDGNELEYLFQRIIKFLAMYKGISPTLRADAQILTGVYYKIFKESSRPGTFTSSGL
jgi:hypothetical protein